MQCCSPLAVRAVVLARVLAVPVPVVQQGFGLRLCG